MPNKILNKIQKILKLDEITKIEKQLKGISVNVEKYIEEQKINSHTRILWGPSFNFENYSVIHNVILYNSLKLRGAEIIPLSCSGIQYNECTVWGGDFAEYGTSNYIKRRQKVCKFCQKQDEKIFRDICGDKLIYLTEFITKDERNEIISKVSKIKNKDIFDYKYDEISFGGLVKDKTLNLYLSGTLDDLRYKYESGRNHLISALILHKVYGRVLEKIKIDRVITSGGDYYQYILLRILANRLNISTYHYNYAGRAGTWTYALNEASNNMNFKSAWKEYQKRELTQKQNEKLNSYLKFRSDGANTDVLSYVNDTKLKFSELNEIWANYDNSKPLVLLAANMVWDAAALNKEIFFSDMFDWTINTMKYFMENKQWQLIVKPHPAESHSKIRKTKQTLLGEIEKANLKITDNILILDSDTKISPYDLYQFCDLGLIYTSTVGIELAMLGKPVIVTGKTSYRNAGFTFDPKNKSEYYLFIEKTLNQSLLIDKKFNIDLSRKYFYFYHFHYLIDLGIATYRWGDKVELNIESFEEILPGANKYLDYVCDSIIKDLPIISETRWPPES
ncbi:MAG: hypothetical protein IIC75_02510 [Bacteroidetes bacterium]|nr:hypothetical protein [Bacteroidota bacterium]